MGIRTGPSPLPPLRNAPLLPARMEVSMDAPSAAAATQDLGPSSPDSFVPSPSPNRGPNAPRIMTLAMQLGQATSQEGKKTQDSNADLSLVAADRVKRMMASLKDSGAPAAPTRRPAQKLL